MAPDRPPCARCSGTTIACVSDFGLDLPLVHSGKVRRLYALPDDRLLMITTNTISAYDHVLATTIPDKGTTLTQLSL